MCLSNSLLEMLRSRALQKSPIDTDNAMIARGFSSVAATIRRDEDLCGAGAYEKVIEGRRSSEMVERGARKERFLRVELSQALRSGVADADYVVNSILGDDDLLCFQKKNLLRRLVPGWFADIVSRTEPIMSAAAREEQARVCVTVPRLHEVASDHGSVAMDRKVVWNEVAEDAYGELGFEKRGTGHGLVRLWKVLSDKYAVGVEVDLQALLAPRLPCLDVTVYLCSANKRDRRRLFLLMPGFLTYSFGVYRSFADYESLEVAIRAKAALYEIESMPLESVISSVVCD